VDIEVLTNEIDPTRDAYTHSFLASQVAGLNQQATELTIGQTQEESRGLLDTVRQAGRATDNPPSELADAEEALTKFNETPADVMSAPFRLHLDNTSVIVPSNVRFYGPAVLALLLQHLGVTLGALSLNRIRLLGIMDMLRVSPVRPAEAAIGNYLSYIVLCAVVAVALSAALIWLLGVPFLGSYTVFAIGLAMVILSSLGIGFLIALFSSSEQQAAQLTMLVLLASVFFSGLVFSLDRIVWPIRAISMVLPSTYGIRLLQDTMLRGDFLSYLDVAVLGAMAAGLFVAMLYFLRREWQPE
jgi:ABC-2 type transport system permease protein